MKGSSKGIKKLKKTSEFVRRRESSRRSSSLATAAAAAEFNRNHPGYIKSKTCGLLSRNVNKDGEAIIGDGLLYASTLTNIDLHPAVSRFFRSSNIQDFLGELNDEDGLGLRLSEISITEDDANRYYSVFARAFERYDEREVTTRLISLMFIIYEEKSGIASSEFIAHQDWGMLAGGLLAFATDNDPNPSQPAAFAHKADLVALNEDKSQIKACIELKKRQLRRDANGTRSFDGPDSLKTQTLGSHFGSGAKYTLSVRIEGFTGIFNRSTDIDDEIKCYKAPGRGMYQFDFIHVRQEFCLALYGIVRMCAFTFIPQLAPARIDLSTLSVREKNTLSIHKPRIDHLVTDPKPKRSKKGKPSKVKRLVLDTKGKKHLITALNGTNANFKETNILDDISLYMQQTEDDEETIDTIFQGNRMHL